ncbi:Ubiquinone biosynthesis hydroxylase, UbiH/UbiF/VisC/COQ6 family [Shewanella halifaxensis HAW-EB4]|uniref:Ubiquinone biosynthesis hydroxylase, UbiH/UbiF/VisC/COQ6 family n=1 Tax=Shewanella halifaxensis (strain HAW-EB4) TaxID=458817 RepID=B0TR36_SHEHH|nr:FAD-dependent monooxygenase [Shewanella halifaxensis]ABZ77767.1 Ubiquinone biosynthesis hydroxylase, UbiH/UbiF/VisC/COQ6 family [Shewanella halifaxensis HAW-EB4]
MEQTSTKINLYDAVVVGGGMVGAATAIGLGQLGLKVAIVEAFAPKAYDSEQPLDLRVSAISAASEALLERLGALAGLDGMRKVAYKGLETWEMDGCITRFHSDQIGSSHLGHILENRLIQLSLWQRMEQLDNITLFCPTKIAKLSRSSTQEQITVELDSGELFMTRLLVGADGANSMVRQWANIGITGWDYGQSAMLINIETASEEQDVTWQQFTPSGPRSLLPLPGNHASLVWYDDANKIAQLSQLNNLALKAQIDQYFPERLERDFQVINKASFKLTRRHAQVYYRDNLVILGDAAHTINPLAGQGVNLGFKDVDALVNTIASHIDDEKGWWHSQVLEKYQKCRYRDNQLMMSTMDLFYASFSNDILPLKILRNGVLKLANIDGPIKKQVLKYAMGF